VFLERRTTMDLAHNAMTGVFMRLLEYYKGILFLTTNRDSAFDDALLSRIAMKLRYERHNEDQRKTMWTKMLERVGFRGVLAEDLAEFAIPNLNGREIRNIVKTAHLLLRSEDDKAIPEIEYVKKALKVYKDSSQVWTGNHATSALGKKGEPT
jgi:AAA+ superfamily predicted ATPase